MIQELLRHTEAYEVGRATGQHLLDRRINQYNSATNPYAHNTLEYRAWNLGFDDVLKTEQP